MVSRIMMLAISLLATSLTIMLSSSSLMLVEAKPFQKMKRAGPNKDGREKPSVRQKFTDRLAKKKMEREKRHGDDPRDVGSGEDVKRKIFDKDDGFLHKFEKMASKLGLEGEKLEAFQKEVKEHSKERVKLTQLRREIIKKYGNDAKNPEARKELAEVENGLKKITEKHREVLKAARDSKDKRKRDMALERARAKRDPNAEKLAKGERELAGHTERRIARTKAQMNSLWEEAQKAGFSSDELDAIKSEIDEFIQTESDVLSEMAENMPLKDRKRGKKPKQTPEERKEGNSHRRDIAKKMKGLSERRRDLEKRIRSREL